MGKKSGSKPPPAPNYSQLATEQAGIDKEALAQNAWANRPNQFTPWGSTTWGATSNTDPATGKPVTQWTQSEELRPDAQRGLDAQMGIAGDRSQIAQGLTGWAHEAYLRPFDSSSARNVMEIQDPTAYRDEATDRAYAQSASRLDPRFEQGGQAMEVKLRNQGLAPGDEAYDAAMGNFSRAKNDAYQSAANNAFSEGRSEFQGLYGQQLAAQDQSARLREQQLSEMLRERNMPLTEQNYLLAGQGAQGAQTPGFQQINTGGGADMMGAANKQYRASQDAYNAQQQSRQGMMSGLGGLANLGISAYGAGMFSDRRLKKDALQIGWWRGRKLYHFFYVWGEAAIGVMSDEVNPDAVHMHPSGFDRVDYSAVSAV